MNSRLNSWIWQAALEKPCCGSVARVTWVILQNVTFYYFFWAVSVGVLARILVLVKSCWTTFLAPDHLHYRLLLFSL